MEVRTEVIYPTPPRRWRCPIVRPSLLASLLEPTQVQSRSHPSVLAAMHATFNSGMSPTQSPYRLGPAGCVRRPLPHPETRRHRVRAAAAPRQPLNRALGRPYLPLKLCAHLRWQLGSLRSLAYRRPTLCQDGSVSPAVLLFYVSCDTGLAQLMRIQPQRGYAEVTAGYEVKQGVHTVETVLRGRGEA